METFTECSGENQTLILNGTPADTHARTHAHKHDHLESVFQVPSQERRGEQYLVAVETAHEHAPRSRHDVVFFGVSAHERSEIVAGQTDVFKHRLHFGKMRV